VYLLQLFLDVFTHIVGPFHCGGGVEGCGCSTGTSYLVAALYVVPFVAVLVVEVAVEEALDGISSFLII